QQSCANHLLERLAVARIRRVRQKDDAPEVQRRLLRPTYAVSDMKEGLEGTRYKSVAAFFNHLWPSQEIDGLLGIADENILKDASFLRRSLCGFAGPLMGPNDSARRLRPVLPVVIAARMDHECR